MRDTLASAETSELLQLARQMADDLHALRQADERKIGGDSVVADRGQLTILLAAIAAATQGRLKFTVAELLVHAEVVADRAADQRLHDAIVGACGAVNGRQLGKLLARMEGREIDGRRVVRAGTGRDGITWRVAGLRV